MRTVLEGLPDVTRAYLPRRELLGSLSTSCALARSGRYSGSRLNVDVVTAAGIPTPDMTGR